MSLLPSKSPQTLIYEEKQRIGKIISRENIITESSG
jgi:hypothetical protein